MTTNDFTIRPAVPEQDYEPLTAILNQVWSIPTTAANLREWDGFDAPGRILQRLVLEVQEQIIGYGIVRHQAHEPDGRFYIWVCVDLAQRRQGWGQKLYEAVLALALAKGSTFLDTDVRDDCPVCFRFAEKRGFTLDRHLYESTINLSTFDEEAFAGLVELVEAAGIRFTSLAAEGDTELARRKLHALNAACSLDDPATHGTFPGFDEFNAMWNKASWFLPEGQLLAVDGERYVGLAAVGYFQELNSMYNLMTGVDQAYRGRKIAQALKLHSIHFARTFGVDTIRTHNDSQNGTMLAINRKLGYQPRPGEYRLIKRI